MVGKPAFSACVGCFGCRRQSFLRSPPTVCKLIVEELFPPERQRFRANGVLSALWFYVVACAVPASRPLDPLFFRSRGASFEMFQKTCSLFLRWKDYVTSERTERKSGAGNWYRPHESSTAHLDQSKPWSSMRNTAARIMAINSVI